MNESGRSAGPARGAYKLELDHVLAVHDEIDLPFGDIRERLGGGLAGHNGLKSLKRELGSPGLPPRPRRRRPPGLHRPGDRLRLRARLLAPAPRRGRRPHHRRGGRGRARDRPLTASGPHSGGIRVRRADILARRPAVDLNSVERRAAGCARSARSNNQEVAPVTMHRSFLRAAVALSALVALGIGASSAARGGLARRSPTSRRRRTKTKTYSKSQIKKLVRKEAKKHPGPAGARRSRRPRRSCRSRRSRGRLPAPAPRSSPARPTRASPTRAAAPSSTRTACACRLSARSTASTVRSTVASAVMNLFGTASGRQLVRLRQREHDHQRRLRPDASGWRHRRLRHRHVHPARLVDGPVRQLRRHRGRRRPAGRLHLLRDDRQGVGTPEDAPARPFRSRRRHPALR